MIKTKDRLYGIRKDLPTLSVYCPNSLNRTGFILGCENWDRYDFKALLKLVKSFVLLVWGMRKNKIMVIRMVQPLVALALVL